jgi:cytochrome c-type biogenesis protein CcmH/NrfG
MTARAERETGGSYPASQDHERGTAYLAAYSILDNDVAHAAMLLQKLMAERPADLAVRRLAERLSPTRKSDRSPT